MRADVYQKVTDRIVAALEEGVRPWHQPWSAAVAEGRITQPLRANGVPYQGINVVMLWSATTLKRYAAPMWMTFRQAKELGAGVRKGEEGKRLFENGVPPRGLSLVATRSTPRGVLLNTYRSAGPFPKV